MRPKQVIYWPNFVTRRRRRRRRRRRMLLRGWRKSRSSSWCPTSGSTQLWQTDAFV